MPVSKKRLAVVTGGNRGLGFETSRQLAAKGLKVVLTSRDPKKGKLAAQTLSQEGLDVVSYPLDITDSESMCSLVIQLQRDFGRVDVLVNNAAVLLDTTVKNHYDERDFGPGEGSVLTVTRSTMEETMSVNVYGPLLLSQLIVPMMKDLKYGRIVNVSSNFGQLSNIAGQWPAYRISKVALNAVTGVFADEIKGYNILINSADPGWAKTDMGGPGAPLAPEEAVDTIVWLSTLPDDGPSGKFFRKRRVIAW
ncbi:MAG: short-chain dehydrogenase [Candidatus Melainabacteria bacterium]|nr:MAG: short-chain dehydrogenase [Candidatus Melainabacteria bacterium]